ncbi:hypothetical protein [Aporhodopirellula aestuarii]|uniref:Uncharacterized protein n=1 Tax=Aporhodopirellula aestuarii TaxID=2950107 RepID=A0ABT0UDZ6_9BACT|nr:hypothetical protein [Aporhodopirellula aestuarii]MCM2375283.1 hypothetical protein [Aporhodopirellula aestuarii]
MPSRLRHSRWNAMQSAVSQVNVEINGNSIDADFKEEAGRTAVRFEGDGLVLEEAQRMKVTLI